MEATVRNTLFRISIIVLCLLTLVASSIMSIVPARAQSVLLVSASASPASVQGGQQVTYTIEVQNGATLNAQGLSVSYTLPSGFSYVSGSAQILLNGTVISTANPTVSGDKLTWSNVLLTGARNSNFYGMHTFVQDRCENGYINGQLDRVREAMGPGAYVKQLFYGITTGTSGPHACWVHFVNACYDRDLIPVVRLAGQHGGQYWLKPYASSPGNYSQIAQAFARIVNGLPQRDGRPLYVEIWNEPNLDLEWSGQANAVEYAQFLVQTAEAIRALNRPNTYILNGGLAPGGSGANNHLTFIDNMATVPGAMQAFDIWSAHPYPGNRPPQFNIHDGTATGHADVSIDSYLLELQRLANHGRKGVPVLITETGYALGQHNFPSLPAIDDHNRADYIMRAFRDYWSQWPEVMGVCPYQLVDPHGVWYVWDWLHTSGAARPQYDAVKGLDKAPSLTRSRVQIRFRAIAVDKTGKFTGRVDVTSGNLGSSSANNVAAVQVTARPTPTPTLSPTPSTPTPIPTPSPTPICHSIVRNGGFETDEAWEMPNTADPARYTTNMVRSGRRSLQVGIINAPPRHSFSSAWQQFTVPSGATSVRIGFWYYPLSGDTSAGQQNVMLMDADKAYLETILRTASNAAKWTYYEYEITGRAGQTLWLYLGVKNVDEAEGSTGMYVDDVDIRACGPSLQAVQVRARLPLILKAGTSKNSIGATFGSSETPPPDEGTGENDEPVEPQVEPAVGDDLPERPVGISALPGRSPEQEAVHAMTLDSTRRRLITATDGWITVADSVTGRVFFRRELPADIHALAVDDASGSIHAVLPDLGELYVLNADGSLRERVSGLGRPADVFADRDRIYLSDVEQNHLYMLDPASYGIMLASEYPVAPHPLMLDSDGSRLYIGQLGEGKVLAVDTETLETVGEVTLGGLGYILDMALDAQHGVLYVAHMLSPRYGAISRIDTDQMVVTVTRWGDLEQPLVGADAISVDSERGTVILGVAEGYLTLDAETLAVQELTRLPRSAWNRTMTFDPLDSTLYVAGQSGQIWTAVLPAENERHHERRR
jgi:uncharacterized repeat protein (TIGR01451 family)